MYYTVSGSECPGDNLSWTDNDAAYLNDTLDDWYYSITYLYPDTGLDHDDISEDGDEVSGGIDYVDIGMVSGHGFCTSGDVGCYATGENPQNCYYGADKNYSTLVMGDSDASCYVGYGSTDNEVNWGDGDLNVLILAACQSLQWCLYAKGAYDHDIVSGNLFALLGAHGSYEDSWFAHEDFKDFVDDTRYNYIGVNWVTAMTATWPGSDDDMCPIAITFGGSAMDALMIGLNAGLDDWYDPGDQSESSIFYHEGCDPGGGPAL